MDLDAKLAADTLRKMADFKQMLAFPHDTGKIINACADLIESLAAELEQVTRERDAAVKDLAIHKFCHLCAEDPIAEEASKCPSCVNKCYWQWRGVKED